MKKMSALLMFVLLAMPLAAAPVLANHSDKGCGQGQCSSKREGCSKGGCGKESNGCPIVDKFMMKAHFFLDNQTEIGLSDEQVSTIKAMKTDMKKTMIRHRAEHQIFMLDMKSKLCESAIDVEGINAMIDEAMTGMASGAKAGVAALAELKGILSEEQMTKAKEIWKK